MAIHEGGAIGGGLYELTAGKEPVASEHQEASGGHGGIACAVIDRCGLYE